MVRLRFSNNNNVLYISVLCSRIFIRTSRCLIMKAETCCTLHNKYCSNKVVIDGFVIHLSRLVFFKQGSAEP